MEMDQVFAEEEPEMKLAMDICNVAPMEEQQKKKEQFTVVLKKREKDITLVLKGNNEHICDVAPMEMDQVFAEKEPEMQLAMDICDVAPMEEQQKKEEEFTVVLKKRDKDITLVLKGNNEQEYTVVIKKSEH